MALALIAIRLPAQPAERFWWSGRINGKPVRLVLDTGCSDLLLWRSAADRLGLKLTPAKLDSNTWLTGEFELVLPHWQRRWGFPLTAYGPARASVCETPVWAEDMDGCLGWPMISRRITRFDAVAGKFELLSKVPKQVKAWSKFTIRTNVDVLVLDLPGDDTHGGLHIDTGDLGEQTIGLSPPLWDPWMAVHPNERRGIWSISQLGGLIPCEVTQASRFSIGGLTLTDVVLCRIEEDDWPGHLRGCAARIGFELLKRFDLVVDGEHALAYLQPSERWKPFTAKPPSRTSFSAVFGPWRDQTNGFAAYVINASPAFESGIRAGDILLKVDGQDVKQWLDNPGKGWSSDRDQSGFQQIYPSTNSPNGTMLELTLSRRDQVFRVTVLQSQIAVMALRKAK